MTTADDDEFLRNNFDYGATGMVDESWKLRLGTGVPEVININGKFVPPAINIYSGGAISTAYVAHFAGSSGNEASDRAVELIDSSPDEDFDSCCLGKTQVDERSNLVVI